MRGMLKTYVRFCDWIVTIFGYISGILIFITAGMIFYEIVARSLFNAPTTWANELTVYAVIASAFLGAAYTLKEDGHIRVDFLVNKLSEKLNSVLLVLIYTLGLIFSLILFSYGVDMVRRTFLIGLTSASVLRIPMYIPYLFIPTGALILALQFIRKVITSILPELTPESKEKEGLH